MTLTKEELEKRVSILERKALREKKARILAENQLEKYSLNIYTANQSLERALASSQQKQLKLEYLSQTSSDVASEISLVEMISNMVKLTGNFCSANCGCFIVTKNGKEVNGNLTYGWHADENYQETGEFKAFIKGTLPLADLTILEAWIVSDIKHPQNSEPQGSLFYTNFELATDEIGWLIFINQNNEFDNKTRTVLNTSRQHFISGIRRRLTEVEILKRNTQLENSIDKLEKARRQLIQSEKMASLGQLAAGVAHEINNPIAFISSNMEVLKDYLADYKKLNEELKENFDQNSLLEASVYEAICKKIDLSYIEEDSDDLLQSNIEGLERVKEIINNLKCFSHSGDDILLEISLNTCILAALRITGNLFKYEHKVVNKITDSCPLILGNTGQLQQVFVNLFVNAAHAMESSGELTIDFTHEEEGITVHVSDSGKGMDESTLKKLFTPFFTTKPVGKGTGLGLSVSYAILEAHGAKITVDSKLNVGTTFNILFPVIS